MNATRSYSKRPSPSDTEYEIARVRGDTTPPTLSTRIFRDLRTPTANIDIYVYTNRGTNVPRTSLPCPPRYGNSTRRRFAKALGANHLLVYYRSGGGSTGLRQVRPPLLSHTILTRETGTKIHMYYILHNTARNFRKINTTIIRYYSNGRFIRTSKTPEHHSV